MGKTGLQQGDHPIGTDEMQVKAESPAQEDWQALGPEVHEDPRVFVQLEFNATPDTNEPPFVGSTGSGHTIADQNSVDELGRTYHGYKEGREL